MSSEVISSFSTINSGCAADNSEACLSVSVVAITLWPRSAKAMLAPRPKPEPAPVIRTVLPMVTLREG